MNFFKGKLKHPKACSLENDSQFWDKTEFKTRAANSYDTIDRNRPDGRDNFLMDLNKSYSDRFKNIPYKMRSKINPNFLVSENEWVVSLVRKKDHAVIAVESVGFGDDQGLCLRWFDFLPKNKPNAPRSCFGVLTNFKALENKKVTGMVRYCPTNAGKPLLNIPEHLTKHMIFKKLNWNEDTDSWLCSPQAVKAMMDYIKNDFKLSDEGKLQFQFDGHTTPNCTTWTWDKLQAAGINAENYNFQNRFIIRASKNVGSKRHH